MKNKPIYWVERLNSPSIPIDADWNKAEWQHHQAIHLENMMGTAPDFFPVTAAKLMYDDHHIYGIFRVDDRYVRSIVKEVNGNVSADSCVEFFFSPDSEVPGHYFNLEINAGGTPLMHYVTIPRKEFTKLGAEDFEQIEIAHSLPPIIDPEIAGLVSWTIEYRVPFSMLEKYSKITRPRAGATWRANFYKTAGHTSNPHYLTWSPVDNPHPDFHLPKYFGTLKFK